MKLTEETVDSQIIYEGKILNLRKDKVKLENDKITVREVIENRNACCVVAKDKENNIIFVDQYRYPMGKIMRELPAGKLDEGETPEEGCRRELLEETGLIADKLIYAGKLYPSVAFLTEEIHIFFAEGLTQSKQCLDEDEFINVVKIPQEQAIQMVMNGELPDAKTQIGLLKYFYSQK